MQPRYAGGRGVGAACSVWGWGCGRDVAQRREECGKRECGCGTRQGCGTREGCGMRKGRGTREWGYSTREGRGTREWGCGTREGRGMREWDNASKQR